MTVSSSLLSRALPAGSHLIESRRDFIIVRLPSGQQLAVIWDRGRDEQILDCITALAYREPRVLDRIVALRMERGVLTCWYAPAWQASAATMEHDRIAVQQACDTALAPKRWTVAPLEVVPIDAHHDRRILDRASLAKDHVLLQIPQQFQLGRVKEVRS